MKKKGFTFLEIVVALFILTIVLVGFLQIFNIAMDASYRARQETIATNLGRGLIAEIMTKNFTDPVPGCFTLGPEAGETNRSTFNDVDDYKDYYEAPPLGGISGDLGASSMNGSGGTPDYSRFSRGMSVSYCNISGNNISDVGAGTPTDYKHIKVTVNGPYASNITVDEIKAK